MCSTRVYQCKLWCYTCTSPLSTCDGKLAWLASYLVSKVGHNGPPGALVVGQTTDTQLITLPLAIVYGVIADLWAHQLLLKEHSNELESLNIMFITGWSAQLANFLFLKRRWEEDEKEFHDKLLYLNSMNCPCQLLLFPEGGDITHKTKKRSDKYADENCLPRYQYCLHPRTSGFIYVMNALRSGGLDAVYDVTIDYPDSLPKTEVELAKGIMPREVHFHIKSYDDGDPVSYTHLTLPTIYSV